MPSQNQLRKHSTVNDLHSHLQEIPYAVITHYAGINVEKMTELRKQLRDNNISFSVIKNSLAQRAIEGTALEALKESFKGPTALAYSDKDPVALAKVLTEFAKTEENLKIQAGVLSSRLLSKADVEALAKVPSREVLLGRMVGSLQSPYAGFVYTLSGVLRKLVYALDAVRRKKEEEGK